MEALGIDPLTAPVEMTRGVGTEGVPTHFAEISIDLQGLIRFPVFAGFTTGLDPLALGLLGQVGFRSIQSWVSTVRKNLLDRNS
jgi:hypothetical protein